MFKSVSLACSISIVGCGTLGSSLAYQLCQLSLEKDINIKSLFLVEYDTLESKNLPFLSIGRGSSHIGLPKGEALSLIINDINPKLQIHSICEKYPLPEGHICYHSRMIDCRDTVGEDPRFFMKINNDGQFGLINLNPKDKFKTKKTRYQFNNSRYYANIMSMIVCQILIDNEYREKLGKKKYGVYMKEGRQLYEIPE